MLYDTFTIGINYMPTRRLYISEKIMIMRCISQESNNSINFSKIPSYFVKQNIMFFGLCI